ncbi:hypothetical protein T492DRAFT_866383 [Pavlovales sp. CCMP2436]|nr:hypothetical protein T492DRAFT_866383 [Pavlovales sp. CCMP2436]
MVQAAPPANAHGNAAYMKQRLALLEEEKRLTHESDKLAAARRALPKVDVYNPESYVFETTEGKRNLLELFDGHSQLIVFHFMHGGSDESHKCETSAFWADSFNGCNARTCARELKARMGWADIRFASAHDEHGSKFRFNEMMGVTHEPDPGFDSTVHYNFRSTDFPRKHGPGTRMSVFQIGPAPKDGAPPSCLPHLLGIRAR